MDEALPAQSLWPGIGVLSPVSTPTRRALLTAGLTAALFGPSDGWSGDHRPAVVRIANAGPRRAISAAIYGSNEIGTLDGPASAPLDHAAGVGARRLGGNLMTTYNWTLNRSNGGKDDLQANRNYFPDLLGLPQAERARPGAVIEAFHQATLRMGAVSLVTLPLAGFVAADAEGVVAEADRAPSRRFVPVVWSSKTRAADPVDPRVADIPHLLRRLKARFGPAEDAAGIRAYALDNEPGLWFQTHPRVAPRRVTIADFLARSLQAARTIKAIDPSAWVLGPVSWGATEMATFQDAPDWPDYAHYGSFLAAYLDAFRVASERVGIRLLDMLDIHWYAFSDHGTLYRSEDPKLSRFILEAPRSLTEAGFREASWVSKALPLATDGGLALPLLPSLDRLVAEFFPSTRVAVTEFNYGGAGQVASGLAVADALGRFGSASVAFAAHWGSLSGWLNQAYRLFRNYDGQGGRFGDGALGVDVDQPDRLSGFAAVSRGEPRRLNAILINRSDAELPVDLMFDGALPQARVQAYGFDADHPVTCAIGAPFAVSGSMPRLSLPPRSARHYVFDGLEPV